jgi:hypothetical protein
MPDKIYLVDLNAYDPATDSEVVCRFSTYGFDAGGGVYYEPRIIQPGTLSRSISTGQIGGRQAVSYGEISLAAIDGGIDYLADYFFDAREAVLRVGRVGQPFDAFQVIMRAQMEAVSVEREVVSIRLRDRAVTLERPFSTAKYLGTNYAPEVPEGEDEVFLGLEGTADDIKDRQKPFIGGRVSLMEPVMVNTGQLIYQCHLYRVDAVLNVFDSGVYISRDTDDYRTIEELQNEDFAPSAGYYRVYSGEEGTYFKLGSSPAGTVSCSLVESWTRNSAAELIRRAIEYASYFSPTSTAPSDAWDWHHWDLLALDEANASPLGIVLEDGETTASVLDRICESVGAFWGFDSLGKLRVVRIDEPAATPDLILGNQQMKEADRTPEGQMPFWSVTVQSDRNYITQDKNSMAGIVPAARAEWFASEYRKSNVKDEDIRTTRLLAQEGDYTSLLAGIGPAQVEAQRRLDLFSVRRDVGTITAPDPGQYGDALDLGKTVQVVLPRLGYNTGRNMLVIGIQTDWGRDQAVVTLWG